METNRLTSLLGFFLLGYPILSAGARAEVRSETVPEDRCCDGPAAGEIGDAAMTGIVQEIDLPGRLARSRMNARINHQCLSLSSLNLAEEHCLRRDTREAVITQPSDFRTPEVANELTTRPINRTEVTRGM